MLLLPVAVAHSILACHRLDVNCYEARHKNQPPGKTPEVFQISGVFMPFSQTPNLGYTLGQEHSIQDR